MKILYLAHRIPYPPNKGDKIRSYHHVRYLAERHDLHLLAFFDDPQDAQWAAVLRQWCGEVVLVPIRRSTALLRGATSMACGRSLTEGYFGGLGMSRAVRVAAHESIDVAWAFSSAMAQYLPATGARLRVADFVDIDSEKWRQFAEHTTLPAGWMYRLESRRLRRLEASAARLAERVLLVSQGEADVFGALCSGAVETRVVPNGVDTSYFHPSAHRALADGAALLFTGALDYRPNVDAVLVASREVLPLVRSHAPDAYVLAVGHRPAPVLQQEAGRRGSCLEVAGSVPDVRPYFERAAVYVAPLRLGRGVQNKILEAMAMRVPVVASPVAVAGLDLVADRHVLIADSPPAFAAAVLRLLGDAELGCRLADAAYRLIEERYGWETNLKLLDDCLTLPRAGQEAA